MKKGISNIIVLALVIVNLVLTVILVFTFRHQLRKPIILLLKFVIWLTWRLVRTVTNRK